MCMALQATDIVQDLEYLGSNALAPGPYHVTISCPSYLKAMATTGWTATGQDSGTISGTVDVVSSLPLSRFQKLAKSEDKLGRTPSPNAFAIFLFLSIYLLHGPHSMLSYRYLVLFLEHSGCAVLYSQVGSWWLPFRSPFEF